ncbi:hypothetical protein RIF25_09955 [Thermosynechococcaceae cyanobacterium BACA0444]|uniref:Uncharacterized protein n=1 Tax=Pseudocalidococcus azoricus BACA0444 TaxID=2918990 RepID=A0AAE4FSS8_9CYAN|nr:hypothetical protein [Pseudocalidococcus azoricus]MDS3861128.1 hypothetical protein [Pseudocalidococcus azoricus BACA0444]
MTYSWIVPQVLIPGLATILLSTFAGSSPKYQELNAANTHHIGFREIASETLIAQNNPPAIDSNPESTYQVDNPQFFLDQIVIKHGFSALVLTFVASSTVSISLFLLFSRNNRQLGQSYQSPDKILKSNRKKDQIDMASLMTVLSKFSEKLDQYEQKNQERIASIENSLINLEKLVQLQLNSEVIKIDQPPQQKNKVVENLDTYTTNTSGILQTTIDDNHKLHSQQKQDYIEWLNLLAQRLEAIKGDFHYQWVFLRKFLDDYHSFLHKKDSYSSNFPTIASWLESKGVSVKSCSSSQSCFESLADKLQKTEISPLHQAIKQAISGNETTIEIDFEKKHEIVRNSCLKLAEAFHKHGLTEEYHYDKTSNILNIKIKDDPNVRNFINGDWFEVATRQKVLSVVKQVEYLEKVKIYFSENNNGNLDAEIDLIFKLPKKYLIVECKSASHRDCPESFLRYQSIQERFGRDDNVILIVFYSLNRDTARDLERKYSLKVITFGDLASTLRKLSS